MLSGLLLLCAGFAAVSSAEPNEMVIFQPFNSNLSLICNHGKDPSEVIVTGWYYSEDERRGVRDVTLFRAAGKDQDFVGTAVINNTLVSFDFESGNIVVKEIHCYENRFFECHIFGSTWSSAPARKVVYLGRPDYPQVTVSSDINSVGLSNSTECTPFTVTTDTVTVELSVSSRPKVNISMNGQAVNPTCNPYGLCADSGQVRCVMMEMLRVTMERELRIVITYMALANEQGYQQLLSWNYCVYFDIVTSTTMTPAHFTVAKVTTTTTRSTPDDEKNGEDEQEDGEEEDKEDGDDKDHEKERSTSGAVILKIMTTCIICSVMIAIFL